MRISIPLICLLTTLLLLLTGCPEPAGSGGQPADDAQGPQPPTDQERIAAKRQEMVRHWLEMRIYSSIQDIKHYPDQFRALDPDEVIHRPEPPEPPPVEHRTPVLLQGAVVGLPLVGLQQPRLEVGADFVKLSYKLEQFALEVVDRSGSAILTETLEGYLNDDPQLEAALLKRVGPRLIHWAEQEGLPLDKVEAELQAFDAERVTWAERYRGSFATLWDFMYAALKVDENQGPQEPDAYSHYRVGRLALLKKKLSRMVGPYGADLKAEAVSGENVLGVRRGRPRHDQELYLLYVGSGDVWVEVHLLNPEPGPHSNKFLERLADSIVAGESDAGRAALASPPEVPAQLQPVQAGLAALTAFNRQPDVDRAEGLIRAWQAVPGVDAQQMDRLVEQVIARLGLEGEAGERLRQAGN